MCDLLNKSDYVKYKLVPSDACPTFLPADKLCVSPHGCILVPVYFTDSHIVHKKVYLQDRCPFTLIVGSTFANDHHLQLNYGNKASKFNNICVPFTTRLVTKAVLHQPVMLVDMITIPFFSII